MTRRLIYVTGTRADFGLMLPILKAIQAQPGFEVELVVTGMHLCDLFGGTEREVEASGLPIAARFPVPIDDDSGGGMARCAGIFSAEIAEFLATYRPDGIILLGDRWEMLAAALPALLCGIPIIHLCGGERSGTVDENIRHAVSKLAHLHLVANEDSAHRLRAMGEEEWRIHIIGAPGLVGLKELASQSRQDLGARYAFDAERPFALVLFHPVVQDADIAEEPVKLALSCLLSRGIPAVVLMPNADHGSGRIRKEIAATAQGGGVSVVTHMPRADFVSMLAQAAVMVGNSSGGIVEAASLGTPVVNIGDRQHGRLRNDNTFDAQAEFGAIDAALDDATAWLHTSCDNVYGDGRSDELVVDILSRLDWDDLRLLKKQMSY